MKTRYVQKTISILLVAVAAFNLGRYSVEFSGRTAAWIAVVCSLIVLAVGLVALISGFRDTASRG
jgi:hypothetical protein